MKAKDLINQAKPHYDEGQMEILQKAIEFATEAHKEQKRDSGEPYIIHPLSVAGILIEWKLDIYSIVAGILHDTAEDGHTTIAEIEQQFGKDVAFLVDGVSKISKARSGMSDIDSYLPKTKDNLSKLLIAISRDLRVILIKLADRLHNLRTLKYLSKERQIKIAKESIQIFAPLADRLGMGQAKIEIEEISFAVLEPEEYSRLQGLIKQKLGKGKKQIRAIKHEVAKSLGGEKISFQMDGRVKSTYSLYKKLKKMDGDIDAIYDLLALRIIVDEKEDCYKVLGILHSLYQPVISKIKDYISVPKPNGYQSLHTTVLTNNEKIVEFQIRTKYMHEYAERGLAASFHYNEQKLTKDYTSGVSKSLPRNMGWITKLNDIVSKITKGDSVDRGELSIDLFDDRIFVYSPKGDIYNLPEGSFPLDFAYAIHSDIGHTAFGFTVNGSIVKFDYKLQNGDIVEVLTRKNVSPKNDWLKHVHTPKAREKIRSFLNSVE